MKLALRVLVAFTLGFVAPCAWASGVLVDASGKVDVAMPGSAAVPGSAGIELPDGSEVSVGEGGSAWVMLMSGAIDQLSPGTKYRVGEVTATAKRAELGAGLSIAMRELASKGEGPTVHGMVKGVRGPSGQVKFSGGKIFGIMAREPTGTAIRLGDKIKFAWDENPPVDWKRPALVVDDINRSHVIVKSLAPHSHEVSVDAKAAGIKKGMSYSWYLATEEGGLKGKGLRFEFKTMSDSAERAIAESSTRIRGLDMSEDGKGLLISGLLVGAGLNLEAAGMLEAIVQKNDSPYARKLLRLANSRMGRE